MNLELARRIVDEALAFARTRNLNPLVVAVLDARGALKALAAEDGTSLHRGDIAINKAYGAIALGQGSRRIMARALTDPHFTSAATHAVGGRLIPVPGGVLVLDSGGALLGAVGISGDSSDNDEAACLAGIAAAGLAADPGA